ncbi:MAG: GGDEF domain-containing protein [Candidatus Gracilibacteria bacterium]|nr:GGDEF domain-containing protein [Candidatus Gracilibacteria bacterium]
MLPRIQQGNVQIDTPIDLGPAEENSFIGESKFNSSLIDTVLSPVQREILLLIQSDQSLSDIVQRDLYNFNKAILANINLITHRRNYVNNLVSNNKTISKNDYNNLLELLLPYIPNSIVKSDISIHKIHSEIQNEGELKYFRILLLSKKKDLAIFSEKKYPQQLINTFNEIPEILSLIGELSKFLVKNTKIEQKLGDFITFLDTFNKSIIEFFKNNIEQNTSISDSKKQDLTKAMVEIDTEVFLLRCMFAGIIDYSECSTADEVRNLFYEKDDTIALMQKRLEGLTHGDNKNIGYADDKRVDFLWENLPIIKSKMDLKFCEEMTRRSIKSENEDCPLTIINSYNLEKKESNIKQMAIRVLIDRYNSYISNGEYENKKKYHTEIDVMNDVLIRLKSKSENLYELLNIACYLYMYGEIVIEDFISTLFSLEILDSEYMIQLEIKRLIFIADKKIIEGKEFSNLQSKRIEYINKLAEDLALMVDLSETQKEKILVESLKNKKLLADYKIALEMLEEHSKKIENESRLDGLTGLLNKVTGEKELHIKYNNVKRLGANSYILYVDLDGFKAVNDRIGHKAGDIVLCKIANVMNEVFLRDEDLKIRAGGDEFILCVDIDKEQHLHAKVLELGNKVSDSLNKFILEKYNDKSLGVHVSLSVGIVKIDKDINLNTQTELADKRMYQAKESGKNGYVFNDSVIHFTQ